MSAASGEQFGGSLGACSGALPLGILFAHKVAVHTVGYVEPFSWALENTIFTNFNPNPVAMSVGNVQSPVNQQLILDLLS